MSKHFRWLVWAGALTVVLLWPNLPSLDACKQDILSILLGHLAC